MSVRRLTQRRVPYGAHGLGGLGKELVVRLVDESKVGHVGDEDVDLDDILKAAASRLEDRLDVL